VKFIYQYPGTHGIERDLLEAGPVAEVAKAIEDAGWDALAFTEHPAPGDRWLEAGGHQTLDPLVALGHAAAATRKIRLLTNLIVAGYRNPLLLAKSAATIDRLSDGRFVLGLGVGYHESEFQALGVAIEERGDLLDEALDVLPLHWQGEPFSYAGRHFTARDVIARPRPVQQPIPVWLGGNSARTLRRVAERAQGWMPLMGNAELFERTKAPPIIDVQMLAEKIGTIRELAGPRFAELDFVAALTGFGDEIAQNDIGRHREQIAELAAVGITHINVPGETRTPAATFRFISEFAAAYIAP
jgi:probable F420-dependent oxidoreductase